MGSECTGKSGRDCYIKVPRGTLVYDAETEELIVDLVTVDHVFCVAKGGEGGLGNLHFKSSTNRAPRRCTSGTLGEERLLRLELKLLADVGLLGFPNAGKSTLIRAVSAARPKVADYPFTTLHPNLGVVKLGYQSFVMADIPGLIEGAAEGQGLGIRFLKHLSRTGILLHLIDFSGFSPNDPVAAFQAIEQELAKYSTELFHKERWLVLNKIDLVPERERKARVTALLKALDWRGPVFEISALTRLGTDELCREIMQTLIDHRKLAVSE